MEELINFKTYPVSEILNKLLQDKTTNKNIVFATDSYKDRGYQESSQITEESISKFSNLELQPRVYKDTKEQSDRTRKKAEVFTPIETCKEMNKLFTKEFSSDWKKSIDTTTLEIACGEAPFLVSRYDAVTGEKKSIEERVGILDRKLKIICENTDNEKDWLKYAKKAYKSTYGYELQGDNLLIARINLLMTFCEYFLYKFNREADKKDIKAIAEIIAWNLWQMDGLKDTVPFGEPENDFVQLSFFDEPEEKEEKSDCIIKNWKTNKEIKFKSIKEGKEMKFDFVIGNPPYQEEYNGSSTGANSIYHIFMDSSYEIGSKVELITPARFLFNAGSSPKIWNKKMLSDNHFKVLNYEPDSSKVFNGVDIKGGVAITYWDSEQNFGAINVFTPFTELNSIIKKVSSRKDFSAITEIMVTSFAYHFTKTLYEENPNLLGRQSKGHDFDLKSNVFEKLSEVFFDEKPDDKNEYIKILGRIENGRGFKYIKKSYVNEVKNLHKCKLFYPKAAGTGAFGEMTPEPVLGDKFVGSTETFLSIGFFDSMKEVENTAKYIKTKFARALLGVLKITQDVTPEKWKYVPLQNFTENSDIDWTKSIAEIDKQLYKKYNLSQEEIDFIESHVKEME